MEDEMRGDSSKTVRRSIALPSDLVEEVRSVAPPELRDNFNRLVTIALHDFAKRRKRESLEKAMAEMAAALLFPSRKGWLKHMELA